MPPRKRKQPEEMEIAVESVVMDPKPSGSGGVVTNEYFRLQSQYYYSHGPRVFLLYEVGAFYEIYGKVEPVPVAATGTRKVSGSGAGAGAGASASASAGAGSDVDSANKYNIESNFVDFLNITGYNVMGNKGTCEGSVVEGAGFRNYMLDDQLSTLISAGYVVVVYSQVADSTASGARGKRKDRELTGIFSPGTYIGAVDDAVGGSGGGGVSGRGAQTNNLMSIWVEEICSSRRPSASSVMRLILGVSVINIISGKTIISENEIKLPNILDTGSASYNAEWLDILDRYLYTYRPTEVLFTGTRHCVDTAIRALGLGNSGVMTHVYYLSIGGAGGGSGVGIGITETELAVAGGCGSPGAMGSGLLSMGSGKMQRSRAESGSFSSVSQFAASEINRINTAKADKCRMPKYVNEILTSLFGKKIMERRQEWSQYEMATRSFCMVVDFVRDHSPELIAHICEPNFHNSTDRVMLGNHSLKQLNILPSGGDTSNAADAGVSSRLGSVVSFLNQAVTPMGHRAIHELISSPIFDEEVLEREYSIVDFLLNQGGNTVDEVRHEMRGIKDMDKILRQLWLGRLTPASLYTLYLSVEKNIGIQTHFFRDSVGAILPKWSEYMSKNGFQGIEMLKRWSDMLKWIRFSVVLDACRNAGSAGGGSGGVLGVGSGGSDAEEPYITSEFVDKCTEDIRVAEAVFTNACARLNAFIGQEHVSIKKTEKGQWSLVITRLRGQNLQKQIADMMDVDNKGGGADNAMKIKWLKECKFVKDGSSENASLSIRHDELTDAADKRSELLKQRRAEMAKLWSEFLVAMRTKWNDDIAECARFAGIVDVVFCKAFLANKYKYCRPQIGGKVVDELSSLSGTEGDVYRDVVSEMEGVESEEEGEMGSWVRVTGLRHLLIEHIRQDEIYIANNVELGRIGSGNGNAKDNTPYGWNIYGTNGAGKTSIIRALGIATIIAQAGFFVPCSSFVYRPFRSIFTRILGNDNLFRGMSSFDVEMSELNTILRRADSRSLILGDELCSGTETGSAVAILGASLEELVRLKSIFLFATHFHEIVHWDEVRAMVQRGELAMKHLTVHYDARMGLVYDRKLKDGAGTALYGLEVCKSLQLPGLIVERAYQLRKKYARLVGVDLGVVDNGNGWDETSVASLDDPTSSYNSSKIRGVCQMCNRAVGEEIHHITPQAMADSNGWIRTSSGEVFHKNHRANLLTVCRACHLKEHHPKSKF